MREKGKTVNELADILGESYTIAWNKKKGRTKLRTLDKKVIAEWLGVNERELEA